MPRGTEHRITGVLVTTAIDYAVDVDGGGCWRVDFRHDRVARDWLDRRVTIRGIRSGFDRLDVDEIGPADG